MTTARVHIICKNYREDRIIPRMARALAERLGWTLSAGPSECDALYLSAYFESQGLHPWPQVPVAAYFSHREEEPPNNAKARLFNAMAKKVQLRVATCRLYAEPLAAYGPTIQAAAPLEVDHFLLARRKPNLRRVIGFSGFTYSNHRKGEDLVTGILNSPLAKGCDFRACGRGWPVPTDRLPWVKVPSFYQQIDVLVVPSRVEGIPMPPLEALACGTPVVIPRHVGLHDELPDVPGIYRYERGDLASLLAALEQALHPDQPVEREALRQAIEPYSLDNWVRDVGQGVETMLNPVLDAGLAETEVETETVEEPIPAQLQEVVEEPVSHGTANKRGIYVVAFGDPARGSALRLMKSIKKHMPDIPICLCADRKIGLEDILVKQPDSDIGGRRAKLKAYELAPAEWQAVLYLDADTEVVAPIYRYFEWIEDGWEFVICKDPHLMDTMHAFERKNNVAEVEELRKKVKTLHTLQYNGGVWAFARNARVAAFFRRWQTEWEKYAQRDQGALIRAMYADPLKVLVLGNQWNTFPKYTRNIQTAGLLHYPGDARRWEGLIPGRIDSPEAWQAVKRFEQIQRRRR